MFTEFLQCLLCASEKAANIGRACRREPALFELLVEEKSLQDFKTLADVLIQETVRHDINKRFPAIGRNIFGEETNSFTNTLGETVTVAVQENEGQTTELLTKVLNNNKEAAAILARHVHEEVRIESLRTSLPQGVPGDLLSVDDIGVWIDPIDATSQYIKGGEEEDVEEGLPPTKGLKVVTVLIGAYSLSSGQPCVGVVNQPFVTGHENLHWGISMEGFRQCSISSVSVAGRSAPRVLVGLTEEERIISQISSHCEVIRARGAGHKLLMVALGLCDAYINTTGSTYKWDTCSPHVLLTSQGGGLKDLKHGGDILYNVSDRANSNGIIAYRDNSLCELLKSITSVTTVD